MTVIVNTVKLVVVFAHLRVRRVAAVFAFEILKTVNAVPCDSIAVARTSATLSTPKVSTCAGAAREAHCSAQGWSALMMATPSLPRASNISPLAIATSSTLIVHNLMKQWGLWKGTGIAFFEREHAPRQELIAATSVLRAAEAQVRQAELRLERSVIEAPISGVALTRELEPGEVVSPGAAITELYRVDRLKAVTGVPENDIVAFRAGGDLALPGAIEYQGLHSDNVWTD